MHAGAEEAGGSMPGSAFLGAEGDDDEGEEPAVAAEQSTEEPVRRKKKKKTKRKHRDTDGDAGVCTIR